MNFCQMCGKPICSGYLCPKCERKEEKQLDIKRRNEKLDEWFYHLNTDKKETIKKNYEKY